jgi:YD repeat-containing protein
MATAPTSRRLNLTRDQLATFLTDQQQIRQFELLFSVADTAQYIPDELTEVSIVAGTAQATANEALARKDEPHVDYCSDLLSQTAEMQKQIDALTLLPRLELLQSIGVTYETVSKNLDAKDASFTYDGSGNLTSITYTSGVIKTLNYTLGILTSVVLSGNTPQNIVKTKTLTYDGSGNLTNTVYT